MELAFGTSSLAFSNFFNDRRPIVSLQHALQAAAALSCRDEGPGRAACGGEEGHGSGGVDAARGRGGPHRAPGGRGASHPRPRLLLSVDLRATHHAAGTAAQEGLERGAAAQGSRHYGLCELSVRDHGTKLR